MRKRKPRTWNTATHYPLRECSRCGRDGWAARLTAPKLAQGSLRRPVAFLCEECFTTHPMEMFFCISEERPEA